MALKTIVYVDGFNLYYGALSGTPYKWLNIRKLCELLLTKNDIVKIKYFTARVSDRGNDPDQPVRQETYFRALRTIPNLEIHLGHFLSHASMKPLANPKPGGNQFAKVIVTQEKGSDVNLASHVLMDAFKGAYDAAIIVSNDSDLYTPLVMVRDEFKKIVGVLNPHADNPRSQPSRQLMKVASFYKPIRKGVLQQSQFPIQLKDAVGTFHKPPSW